MPILNRATIRSVNLVVVFVIILFKQPCCQSIIDHRKDRAMPEDKVIVISIDAAFSTDFDVLKNMKNTGRLLEGSAVIDTVECVYPTYTYPCHASIMTGCWPERHGIYHNELFSPEGDYAPWFFFRKYIKTETAVDVARNHGLTTSMVSWPVMGGRNSSDWTIGEIWTRKASDDPDSVFDEVNTPSVKHIYEKNKGLLNHMKTPEFDNFTSSCACDIIREFSPDLMFIHLSYLDHQRHKCGPEKEKVMHAFSFIDEKIGEIIKAAEEAGIFPDTTFVLLGDHGHMRVDRVFLINRVLMEKGYIRVDNGMVTDWRIMTHSTSFSGQVYLNGISEVEAAAVLEEIKSEYPTLIERILTTKEAEEQFHLSGPFSFVIECTDNTVISTSLNGEIIQKPQDGDYKTNISTHGFSPEKGPTPLFAVCGKRAASGTHVSKARLIDEAPTILSIFGLDMPDADGKVLQSLIKKE